MSIDELVTAVNVALGSAAIDECRAGDADGNGVVAINELISAVSNALGACAIPTATPLPDECPIVAVASLAETGGILEAPSVAVRPNGEFVIAWAHNRLGGPEEPLLVGEVFVQRYDADLRRPLFDPIVERRDEAVSPAASLLRDGRLVLMWGEGSLLGTTDVKLSRIVTRLYRRNATPVRPAEVLVDVPIGTGFLETPDVVTGAGDTLVAGFIRSSVELPGPTLKRSGILQRFQNNAQLVGDATEVDPNGCSGPVRIAAAPSGEFAAVCGSRTLKSGVTARFFNRSGVARGDPVTVVESDRDTIRLPDVGASREHFVVVWEEDRVGMPFVTAARFYDLRGEAIGDRFVAIEKDGSRFGARVAMSPDGDFALLGGSPLSAWRFDANGQLLAGPFGVDDRNNTVVAAEIGIDAQGDLVVVWDDQSAISARRFPIAARDRCEPTFTVTPTPRDTPTVTPIPSATRTATLTPHLSSTATATPNPPVCGDGLLSHDETCASCAADCTPQSCIASGADRLATVSLDIPDGPGVSPIQLRLAYRTNVVSLPPPVSFRVQGAPGIVVRATDNAYELSALVAKTGGLSSGPLFNVSFDHCQGAPEPTAGDFACDVVDCRGLTGCSCSAHL